jgi:hypothetical protein
MSNNVNHDRPSSPLVQQLKQKFDRLTEKYLPNESNKTHSQSQINSSKTHRVGNDEGDGAYPLLPVCGLSFFKA